MCLGIPGDVIELLDRPDLAKVNVSGVSGPSNRTPRERERPAGDWILIHVGFALSKIDEDEAAAALRFSRASHGLHRRARCPDGVEHRIGPAPATGAPWITRDQLE